MKSKFYKYSIGYVVDDKLENDAFINVYPIELYPNMDGDVLSDVADEQVSNKDAFDEHINITIKKSGIIRAKWLPEGNTNRLTAPSVCKGETVMLYRYGDTDKYYWVNMYNEIDLRKRENFIMAFSNKDSVEDPDKIDQMYYISIDTINKMVKFHTDDRDGELTTYDFMLDTKNGSFTLVDGRNNKIELDSAKDKLTVNTNLDIEYNSTNLTTNMSGNEIRTITGRFDTTIGNWTVSNGSDELIALVSEFIQAVIDIQHVGNLGIATNIEGSSKDVLADIKKRMLKFAN